MTDGQARIAIIDELKKNIFVIAGAGSGKTSMLVNRMVALVESGVDISKICAITFTVNAAAEFLERLSDTLKRRSQGITKKEDFYDGGLGNIKDPAVDKKALDNIDLCFAGTIDSFCNLILSEYPLDAGIPSSSSVVMEDEEKELYKQEYASFAKKNDPLFHDFSRLFKNSSKTFANSLDSIITASYLNPDYQKPTMNLDSFIAYIKNKYENGVKTCIQLIANSASSLKTGAGVQSAFANFMNGKNSYLSNWSLAEILSINYLYKDVKELKYSSDPNITGSIAFVQPNKDYVFDVDCDLAKLYKEIEEYKHSVAMEYLLHSAKEVRKNLKDKGKLSFNEYLVTFRDLVIKDMTKPGMPLINHIRKRFTHYLLDESQDTSPFQYELFLYLCSEVPACKIEDVKLVPGSIFIVGDPKQSIYRFRGADIASYNRVKNLFNDKDNIVVELSNNFRSSKLLCEYFNDKFNSMPGYTPIGNVNSKSTTDGQGLYTFGSEIDVIKTIINNPNYQIEYKIDDDHLGKRVLEYKDIMLISKNKDNLIPIAKRLEEENIPYFMEGKNYLNTYPIIEAMYAVYCYITYPDDHNYFLNLLTSPLFGYKRDELLFVSRLTLPSEHVAIIDVIDKLKGTNNPYILLKKIIEQSELFAHVKSLGMSYAYHLLGAFESAYKNNQISSLEDGVSFLADNVNTPIERTAQLTYKPNAIYLANVHKVKGLEAPVVIITSNGNDSKAPQRHIDYIKNESYIFLIQAETNNPNNKSYEMNVSFKYDALVDIEKTEAKEEVERLKYVAVTRARNYLFINPEGRASFWKDMVTGKFVEFPVDDVKVQSFSNKNKVVADNDPILKNKASVKFKMNNTYDVVLPSKLSLDHNQQSNTVNIDDQAKHDAALKGTIVHALMEDYVNSGMKLSVNAVVNSVVNSFSLHGKQEYIDLLTGVMNNMLSGGYVQADGKKEDLFATLAKADEVECEVPFAYKKGNKIYNGSIDLLYKLNGKYYVVDYKTNYDDDSLDKKYANQLNAYVTSLKEIEGADAEARIYHIDIR